MRGTIHEMGQRAIGDLASRFLKGAGIVGSVMASLSVVSLVSTGFRVGWADPFRKVLEQYLIITANIRHYIEPVFSPVLQTLGSVVDIRLEIQTHWADIFILMMIYLGSRLKAYISQEKYVRAVVMLSVALVASLWSSLLGACVALDTWKVALVSALSPLIGFLIYDLIYAGIGGTFDRRPGRSRGIEVFRHLEFSLPLLVWSAVLSVSLILVLTFSQGFSPYKSFVTTFICTYLLITAYWAMRAYLHAVDPRNRLFGETVSRRFARSSATHVAFHVGLVVVSAVIFMCGNAGLLTVEAIFGRIN